MPWVRRAGRWPCGEEWLFQALLQTYIPLLDLVERLGERGIRNAITLGVTPVLIEMLRDPYLIQEFDRYIDGRLALCEADILRFKAAGSPALPLAELERDELLQKRFRWRFCYRQDIIGIIREFARVGNLEILTSAATHAYLPLLQNDASIRAQLINGMSITQEAFNVAPAGIWLPECAYHPRLLPILEDLGLRYFFSDSRAVRRSSDETTLQPFLVAESEVAVFARDEHASGQVWDNDLGYPGDEWYREFHKQDIHSGNRYWRVTDKAAGLNLKAIYEPGRAQDRLAAHAEHFAHSIAQRAIKAHDAKVRNPYIVLTFDAELFGHWWGEGHLWLEAMLSLLQDDGSVVFCGPSQYLQNCPPRRSLKLSESSWGTAGDHSVWNNDSVAWMWREIHRCERSFGNLVGMACGMEAELIKQIARELFLLQSSDWQFLITKQQAADYAVDRFRTHVARFDALVGGGACPAAYEADTLFADIDLSPYGLLRQSAS